MDVALVIGRVMLYPCSSVLVNDIEISSFHGHGFILLVFGRTNWPHHVLYPDTI